MKKPSSQKTLDSITDDRLALLKTINLSVDVLAERLLISIEATLNHLRTSIIGECLIGLNTDAIRTLKIDVNALVSYPEIFSLEDLQLVGSKLMSYDKFSEAFENIKFKCKLKKKRLSNGEVTDFYRVKLIAKLKPITSNES